MRERERERERRGREGGNFLRRFSHFLTPLFVAVVVVVVVVFCRRHAFCGLRVEQVTSDLKGARDILKQLKELPPGA